MYDSSYIQDSTVRVVTPNNGIVLNDEEKRSIEEAIQKVLASRGSNAASIRVDFLPMQEVVDSVLSVGAEFQIKPLEVVAGLQGHHR
ncbi:MAG TPA: hypothetical protein VFB12_18350 [Ktedonobacteraceae bacterium]|nr:hypothetical protein [Ktedonobacteraceae bacterium]